MSTFLGRIFQFVEFVLLLHILFDHLRKRVTIPRVPVSFDKKLACDLVVSDDLEVGLGCVVLIEEGGINDDKSYNSILHDTFSIFNKTYLDVIVQTIDFQLKFLRKLLLREILSFTAFYNELQIIFRQFLKMVL